MASKRQLEANRANAAKVPARKKALERQYRAVTLIGMVYSVGTKPLVLDSPASMQSSHALDAFNSEQLSIGIGLGPPIGIQKDPL